MKRILPAVLAIFLCVSPIFAQKNESDFSINLGADFVSRYVWRGMNLSEAAAIQPTIGFSYKGFSFGSWASYTLSRESVQEIDLYMGYETGRFGFMINNYYNTIDTLGFSGNYFILKPTTTPHVLEGVISIYGSESLPLKLTIATMFFGNDRDEAGNSFYSTYIESGYSISSNEMDVDFFLGFTPAPGLYAERFSVVNAGLSVSRDVSVAESFKLPIKSSFVINPSQEKVFLVFTISL